MIEAHRVDTRLWQGRFPPVGPEVGSSGFTLLVLCALAEEYDRAYRLAWRGLISSDLPRVFPGVRVLHAPNDDSDLKSTPEQIEGARRAAREVVAEVTRGGRVLVTCAQGRNRSGLVVGLALQATHGWSSGRVVGAVRAARGSNALRNDQFIDAIARGDLDRAMRHQPRRRTA